MKKLLLYTFMILLGGLGQLNAQVTTQPGGNQVWSLAECIDYAKQNNLTVSSLKLTQQSTEQDLVLSKAARLPSVTASVTQSLASTNQGLSPASGYGVTSELTLYNGGYLNKDIAQKQLMLQSAGLDVAQAENDITVQILQAYYNIALARENIIYVKDLVATSQAQVDQGETKYKVGSIAKKDLLELQSVLANDEYNLTTAKNTEQQYLLNLKQILQLPSGSTFDVTMSDSSAVSGTAMPLTEAQQAALKTRPEISNSALQIDIANLDIEKAKATGKPTISLGAGISTNYANTLGYNYGKTLGNNLYQQVGVTLSVPIFNKKSTKVQVAKANINLQQANLDAQNTKLTLLNQVEQAFLSVTNAQSQLTAAQKQLNSSEEAFRIANAQLKLGSYNMVDYLQQRNLYVNALQAYTQAKYTASMYLKTYQFYAGVPVTQ